MEGTVWPPGWGGDLEWGGDESAVRARPFTPSVTDDRTTSPRINVDNPTSESSPCSQPSELGEL